MVERGRLEICCALRGTGGSNPSLSAIQSRARAPFLWAPENEPKIQTLSRRFLRQSPSLQGAIGTPLAFLDEFSPDGIFPVRLWMLKKQP